MNARPRTLARALVVLVSCVVASLGQSSGQLHLQVSDPSGAALVAQGKLEPLGAGKSRTFQTNEQGVYDAADLAPGRYRLEITRAGFATESQTVEVPPGVSITREIALELASQSSQIDVVAPTPLAGTDIPIEDIPAPVQTASARDLNDSQALDLSEYFRRRFNGVNVNDNQENPFQPDVNFRGYTASALLGTPEGISVYMDGVRQNQPFGDVVAWDLIPKIAISEVALIPGSDPLFGLNTLGGSISIQTKDGRSEPGTTLQASGGSFGRRQGDFEHGGSNSHGLNWYVAGTLFREDGWRPFSTSEVRQAFGKLGWQLGKTYISGSFGYADNSLAGVGLQDTRFLAEHWSSVYTVPDLTWNRSPSAILSVRHDATNHLTFTGNAYFRYIRADTTNGDINNDSFDQPLYNLSAGDIAALTAAGYSGFPVTGSPATEPFPYWRCIAQGLEMDEPSEKCTGLITNTFAKQHNYGLSGQVGWMKAHNRLTAGSGWDRSNMTFQQGSQFGYLNADHLTITPIDSFANGSTTQGGVPVDTRVNLRGLVNTWSIYATDTITLGPLAFTVSGRYNRTPIKNIDQLPEDPTGARGSLNGRYVFDRLNPAVGFTYSPWTFTSLYFSYSEASRAPTAIELGCADPTEPCNLPNALVGDPPLKQVVTRTFEAGIRGSMEARFHWSAGWFRGENYNDLLFVASEQTGFGYFTNFGKTLRQGAEIDVNGTFHHFTLGGGYTFLSATYESPQTVGSGSNSSNDGGPGMQGNIALMPGDEIPLIPRNILKAYADYEITPKLTLDVDFSAIGRSFVRGNENNRDQPDGVYYLGQGFSPGYAVLNAGAHYQIHPKVQLFVQVDNVLNHRYYTSGQLAPTPYDNAGNFIARPFAAVDGEFPIRNSTFFAPGAPIGAWAGIRVHF